MSLPSADEHPLFYVGGLALIGLLSVVLEMLASIVLILGTYRASRILFGQLLSGVMHATMRCVNMRYHETREIYPSSQMARHYTHWEDSEQVFERYVISRLVKR